MQSDPTFILIYSRLMMSLKGRNMWHYTEENVVILLNKTAFIFRLSPFHVDEISLTLKLIHKSAIESASVLPLHRMVCTNALFFPFKCCRNFAKKKKKSNFLEQVRHSGVENCDRRGGVALFVLHSIICQRAVLERISLEIGTLLPCSCFPPHKTNKVNGPLCLFKTWTSVLYPMPRIRTKLYQKDNAPCHSNFQTSKYAVVSQAWRTCSYTNACLKRNSNVFKIIQALRYVLCH